MSDKTGASTAPKAYQNKVRNFSYTFTPCWRLERGDPTGSAERENIIFMKPTCGFTIHWTHMVPSFSRKALVDASYKSVMEEKSIGKYMAVKRRDQGGKDGVIDWETIETAEKGSAGSSAFNGRPMTGKTIFTASSPIANPRISTPTGRICSASSILSSSDAKPLCWRSPLTGETAFVFGDLIWGRLGLKNSPQKYDL